MSVFVLTGRDNKALRDAVRSTWAKGHPNVYFMVGKPCQYRPKQRKEWTCEPKSASEKVDPAWVEEQDRLTRQLEQEPQVVVLDFVDVYRHLASKLKLSYLWLHEHAPAEYYLKIDDDCFMRVDSTAHWLQNRKVKPQYEIIATGYNANGLCISRS